MLLSFGAARADELITFNYAIGGAIPAAEVRPLVSTGAPLQVTMTFGGGDWLQATLSAKVTPMDLTIAVKPEGLTVGSYRGFVNVSAGPINTLSYIITLNVRAADSVGPTLTVSPATLKLTVAEGEAMLPQRINIASSGDPVEYSLATSSSPKWLDVFADKALPSGAEGGKAPGYFFTLLTSKTLAPAVYTGQITISAPGAANPTILIPVTLTVTRGSTIPGPSTVTKLLPQFVFGDGWYSALYLGNSSANAATVTTQFFTDEGSSLVVPGAGGSVTTVIPGHGSAVIEGLDAGPLTSGWARVIVPAGVSGYAIFRQSAPDAQPQEAVVPLSSMGTPSLRLLFDERSFDTAAAILNPADGTATVTVTARDNAGLVLGSATLTLKASAKTAMRLRDLPELTQMQGRQGTVEISSTQGSVAVLGLRFNGGALTSIPATEP